jgi:hypothetical protein
MPLCCDIWVVAAKPMTTEQEIETWLTAPAEQALTLQRPVDGLTIVARGVKEDKI